MKYVGYVICGYKQNRIEIDLIENPHVREKRQVRIFCYYAGYLYTVFIFL